MKISFFEIENWEKDYLENQFSEADVSFFENKITLDNVDLVRDSEIISIFTDSQISKEILSELPKLKMIVTRSTGFDHIDLETAKRRKILVCNIPTYGENTVAEHTFALILDLSRNIYKSVKKVKESGFQIDGFKGFDLKDKTIGIVGLGHIGMHVARIAKGFDMNVLAFDAYQDKKLARRLRFKYVTFENLLSNSDIITLHIPYNKYTHHMINSSNIHLIKKGAYLINTARGGVVETSALVSALNSGLLSGAGLDVLEGECDIKEEKEILTKGFGEKCDVKTMLQNHILMERDNVIITPHNAFNSKEAIQRILEITVENIKSFMARRPINVVK